MKKISQDNGCLYRCNFTKVIHISQFDTGVRLPSPVTSSSSPPRDGGSVWMFSSSPLLQLNSAAIKIKKKEKKKSNLLIAADAGRGAAWVWYKHSISREETEERKGQAELRDEQKVRRTPFLLCLSTQGLWFRGLVHICRTCLTATTKTHHIVRIAPQNFYCRG